MTDIAVRVENLGKLYRIGQIVGYGTLRESLTNAVAAPFRRLRQTGDRRQKTGQKTDDGRRETEESGLRSPVPSQSLVSGPPSSVPGPPNTIWALKDVSFEVKRGEAVGIIGRNGCGKTTILKILSRITAPTEGYAEVHGRVGSLLEVGTGFHPELTGRENIYLNGAVIGMKKAEVERKFDEIVAFSEIGKFLDTPVKRYSSGMYVRLAFAVAAHLEPEILIVDEVLAVGDAAFQKKCLGKMGAATQEGRTVVFVSHNMAAVKALCSRVLLLDQGTIKLQGLASQVADEYIMEGAGPKSTILAFEEDHKLRIQFLSVQLVESIDSQSREVIQLEFKYVARSVSEDVLLCVEVRNASDVSVFYSNDSLLNETRKREKGIHKVALTIPKYLLAPGAYSIAFGFWEPGHAAEHFPNERLLFRRQEPINRLSAHGIPWPSVIYMSATWSYLETDSQSSVGTTT